MTLPIALDILTEDPAWSEIPDVDALCSAAIEATLDAEGIKLQPDAELSILLTNDERIRTLNREWRQKDQPTNVLSFPAVAIKDLSDAPMLGDIAIAYETVMREAKAEEKTPPDHLTHLLVHGFLHILGHDHLDAASAERMEAREIAILASLGIGSPYANSDLLTAMAEGI